MKCTCCKDETEGTCGTEFCEVCYEILFCEEEKRDVLDSIFRDDGSEC